MILVPKSIVLLGSGNLMVHVENSQEPCNVWLCDFNIFIDVL